MAGHVSVPLCPNISAESAAQILEHSETALVFVGKVDDWPAMSRVVRVGIPAIGLPICPSDWQFDFSWDDLQAWTPIQDNPCGQRDQLATIVYTSGTTGVPKGVMHSFGGLGFAATHGSLMFGLGEKDRLFSCSPLCHVAERMFVEMGSIYCGQSVFFPQGMETLLDDLKRARPTALFGGARVWSGLQSEVYSKLQPARLDLLLGLPLIAQYVRGKVLRCLGIDALKVALIGAALAPESLRVWYRRLGLQLLEVYGMPENCGYSHVCRPGRHKSGRLGQPCPQVEVRIAEDGEVQVRSGATMLGYFKEPLKTAEAITADGFLRTGDKGEQDADGYLRITVAGMSQCISSAQPVSAS
jgi:long-subunit acyl-CoA synthetase (AMP-forming)